MKGRLVRREHLERPELEAMERLLARHFEGVTRATFLRDLAEKNWVVLLEEADRLCGFTTLLTYESEAAGEPLAVVYSGDTIVERDARGSAALPQAWIAAVRALHEAPEARSRRLFWLLLTSGFRTYRFLPVFWREFLPAPMLMARTALSTSTSAATPAARRRLDALAGERLGAAYDADLGVARLTSPQVLVAEQRRIPSGRRSDPYVDFFLSRNPGWEAGDELVCLTEIAASNLTPAGRRMWDRGRIELPPAGDSGFST